VGVPPYYHPHPLGKHESISESNHSSQDFGFSSARGATGYAAAVDATTKPRFILVCQWQKERTHHPTNKPHIIKTVAKCEVLFTTTYKTTIWHQERNW